ncbi:unnamed protein product [Paramecium sonneborni]|uniref:Uncharacterized protein n=1 Tax=Paramecium sonneborni TaxID=65129 RepID=A0A8S1M098_9CILI|nr:unnamed protein product [Paramecium sonneborni]
MCLYDYSMTSFNSNILASYSFIYSITDFLNQNNSQNKELLFIEQQNCVNLIN